MQSVDSWINVHGTFGKRKLTLLKKLNLPISVAKGEASEFPALLSDRIESFRANSSVMCETEDDSGATTNPEPSVCSSPSTISAFRENSSCAIPRDRCVGERPLPSFRLPCFIKASLLLLYVTYF